MIRMPTMVAFGFHDLFWFGPCKVPNCLQKGLLAFEMGFF